MLSVAGLTVTVRGEAGARAVVENLSFRLRRETLCIAGESGSAKSMTALAVMGRLPQPAARIGSGAIRLGEVDLATRDEAGLRRIRGDRIAMFFQEPATPLNPFRTPRGAWDSIRSSGDVLPAHGRRDPEPGAARR